METKFNAYKQDLDNIIVGISSSVARTVITKGEIANPTPYYQERMGNKANLFPSKSSLCCTVIFWSKDSI